MDFIQLLLSNGYKYVIIMVCMFSHWTEAFPCRQATASSVAKVLLEKIILLSNLTVIEELIYWPGALTSLCCLAGFTALSLCLPPSILWFS